MPHSVYLRLYLIDLILTTDCDQINLKIFFFHRSSTIDDSGIAVSPHSTRRVTAPWRPGPTVPWNAHLRSSAAPPPPSLIPDQDLEQVPVIRSADYSGL